MGDGSGVEDVAAAADSGEHVTGFGVPMSASQRGKYDELKDKLRRVEAELVTLDASKQTEGSADGRQLSERLVAALHSLVEKRHDDRLEKLIRRNRFRGEQRKLTMAIAGIRRIPPEVWRLFERPEGSPLVWADESDVSLLVKFAQEDAAGRKKSAEFRCTSDGKTWVVSSEKRLPQRLADRAAALGYEVNLIRWNSWDDAGWQMTVPKDPPGFVMGGLVAVVKDYGAKPWRSPDSR